MKIINFWDKSSTYHVKYTTHAEMAEFHQFSHNDKME
jgi:hypothetical protein